MRTRLRCTEILLVALLARLFRSEVAKADWRSRRRFLGFFRGAVGSAPVLRRFASIVALEPLLARTMRLALKYEGDSGLKLRSRFRAGPILGTRYSWTVHELRAFHRQHAERRRPPRIPDSSSTRWRLFAILAATRTPRQPHWRARARRYLHRRRCESGAALVRRPRRRPRSGSFPTGSNGRVPRYTPVSPILRSQLGRGVFRQAMHRADRGHAAWLCRHVLRRETVAAMD